MLFAASRETHARAAARADSNEGGGGAGERESHHGWMHDHWRGAIHRRKSSLGDAESSLGDAYTVRHEPPPATGDAAMPDSAQELQAEELQAATGGLSTPYAREEEEEADDLARDEEVRHQVLRRRSRCLAVDRRGGSYGERRGTVRGQATPDGGDEIRWGA